MPARKFLVVFVSTALLALGVLFLIGFATDDSPPREPPKPPVKKISVYVSGQVKNISVVELVDNGNLKLVDAVNAAGGLTEFADADAVNLALPLSDGQHVRIPTKEIFHLPKDAATSSNELVNINTADATELATLKGIGSSLAKRILDYRKQNGAFKSVDELKNVSGIGEKKFAALKDKVTI